MNKKWWIPVIIILIAGIGYGGLRLYQSSIGRNPAANGQQAEHETVTVTRQTLEVTVEGSGSVGPNDELSVPFITAGEVVEVLVDIGDKVKANDVLVRLDDTDAKEAVAEAELQVKQAEINLDLAKIEAETGLTAANFEAALADLERVKTNDAHVYDQLTSARIQLQQAKEDLRDAEEAWDDAWDPGRDWELNVRHLKAPLEAERESTEKNLQRAEDSVENAQASYNLAVIGIDKSAVQDAEIQVVNAQLALDKEPIQLEQTALSLEQAQLSLASAQRAVDDLVLFAPVDGIVTELHIKTGQMAGNGQTALVLSDLEHLVVEMGLDETDIAQVMLGQNAVITLDAFDDAVLSGTISDIAPVATVQSGVVLYDVGVSLDPTDLPIKPGMTADVEIIASSAHDVFVVPLKAIRSVGNRTLVLRKLYEGEQAPEMTLGSGPGAAGGLMQDGQQLREGIPPGGMSQQDINAMREQISTIMQSLAVEGFIPVPVELGMVTEAGVEITSGLKEGDLVLLNAATTTEEELQAPPGIGFMMRARP